MFLYALKKNNIFFFVISILSYAFFVMGKVHAETVSGGGYILNQVISPINGNFSGNGYVINQAGQVSGDAILGGGYQSQGVFGVSSVPSVPAPIVTPPSYSGGGGWGYFVLPSGDKVASLDKIATTSPKVNQDTILTANGSTCSTRIALSSPIDIGLKNNPDDVKKLEFFLNTYEGENLKVDGFYDKGDYAAVKKWQAKYRVNILNPMKLKNPTGTVYTSSMRQIERQTTAACGQQVVINACPYFKTYASIGDKSDEVKKIQQFLNIVRGENLILTGRYDSKTLSAVKRFQRFYRKDIVSIVSLSFITGNWNVSTRLKANEIIGCDVLQ
jgi:peptidoglycan hydrolase-like protein with peptidoglycan-binding domain